MNQPVANTTNSALNWPECSVVIIASGPSLTPEDCAKVGQWRAGGEMRRVIVINTSYRLAPFADVLYACDSYWWDKYVNEVDASGFTGQLWTQDKRASDKYVNINYIESQRGLGLSKRPGLIYQGGNSGYQAINLAYLAGANRILLLGFDMQGKHWHSPHPPGLDVGPRFESWIAAFNKLAIDLDAEKISVSNVSRETALTCFVRRSLEAALQ